MKTRLLTAICLAMMMAWAPLTSLSANENIPSGIEARMIEKFEREKSERADYQKASEDEEIEKNHEETHLSNASLFGWGSAPSYTTTHKAAWHFATGVSGKGNHVFLEDGSGWVIASADAPKTLNWFGDDIIMVIPAPWYSFYNYILVNNSTGAHVYADLKEKPKEANIYSLWITEMNPNEGTLTLNDKTVWAIPGSYDRHIMKGWKVNQKVLIGINGSDKWVDQWISKQAPNLLISVEPGIDGYIKGRCEY